MFLCAQHAPDPWRVSQIFQSSPDLVDVAAGINAFQPRQPVVLASQVAGKGDHLVGTYVQPHLHSKQRITGRPGGNGWWAVSAQNCLHSGLAGC